MYSRDHNEDETSWGIHINHRNNMASRSCPEWARGIGKLAWDSLGVIIWDKATHKVYCLSPYQALDI